LEYCTVYTLGALGYGCLELLFRGYTHWSMLLTGGLCLLLLYLIAVRSNWPLPQQWIAGAAIITTLEFLVGIFVNLRFGWAVWDYSDQPLNLFGQICPLFSLLWLLLCIPAVTLCRKLHTCFHQIQCKLSGQK
jgi:uncharacterized membrane protein